MRDKFIYSIVVLFLITPKIPVTDEQGILIGELLLITLGILLVLAKPIIASRLSTQVMTYLLFCVSFILVSSLIAGITHSMNPSLAVFYFLRIFVFIILFWLVVEYANDKSNDELAYKLLIVPFLLHSAIIYTILIHYYATNTPSLSWIMWGYDVGLRLMTISGLTLDFSAPYFLFPKSGSHNIVSGHANLILLLCFTYTGNIKKRNWLILLATITPFFSMSRGGVLTTFIIWMYYLFFSKAISKKARGVILISIVCFVGILNYLILEYDIVIPNIFERITRTFSGGELDSSTMGRLTNYRLLFEEWRSSGINVFFGIGFDPNIVEAITSENRFESFFLQVLFNGGLISLAVLGILFLMIWNRRRKVYWAKLLSVFIIFQSIVMWTVTGADFWSPQISFLIFIMFGLIDVKKLENESSYSA